ncbi:hypothetical protein [Amycolatopsis australiensis]|uniref:Integral membrane protein n=1 Tax=Amycolatopsis australiensis TaxID=546364 RepID=A0A1K1T7Q4_9PSEU|nr:hypothetical protein [Amycolatopsis australiensis]SFW92061.1 hypothetical protein SAMN04489730_8360 [Amycolatopsis australiensis]
MLFAAACWLLAVITGVGAVVLAAAGVMSSDPCRPDDTAFICTDAGQSLAWWLPLAGWAASVLLAWMIVARAGRRSGLRSVGPATGLVLYSGVVAVEWCLVIR